MQYRSPKSQPGAVSVLGNLHHDVAPRRQVLDATLVQYLCPGPDGPRNRFILTKFAKLTECGIGRVTLVRLKAVLVMGISLYKNQSPVVYHELLLLREREKEEPETI